MKKTKSIINLLLMIVCIISLFAVNTYRMQAEGPCPKLGSTNVDIKLDGNANLTFTGEADSTLSSAITVNGTASTGDILVYKTEDNYNYSVLVYDGTNWIKNDTTYTVKALKEITGKSIYVVGEWLSTFEIQTQQEMHDFVSTGGTGKLMNDIGCDSTYNVSKNCVLDLNEKLVKINSSNGGREIFNVSNNAEFTLSNGKVSNFLYGNDGAADAVKVQSGSTFVATSVNLVGGNGNALENAGIATLNNCTVSSYQHIAVINSGTLNFNNTEISRKLHGHPDTTSRGGQKVGVLSSGVLVIDNQSVSTDKKYKEEIVKVSGGTATILSGNFYGKISVTGGSLSIQGGKFYAGETIDNKILSGIYANGGSLSISGGEFNDEIVLESGSTLTLTGGKFSNIIANDNCTLHKDIQFFDNGKVTLAYGKKLTIPSDYTNTIKLHLNYDLDTMAREYEITSEADSSQYSLLNVENTDGIFVIDHKNTSNNKYTVKVKKDISVYYHANGATSGTVPYDGVDHNTLEMQKEPGVSFTVEGNTGNLALTGKKFVGWNTKSNGTGTHYDVGSSISISKKTVLYAEWKQMYSIIYYLNDGTSDSSIDGPKYVKDEVVNISQAVADDFDTSRGGKWSFNHWNTKSDNKGTSYLGNSENTSVTINNSDIKLYAIWDENYKVSYEANDPTSGTVPTDSNYYVAESDFTVLGNTGLLTKTGYKFGGWNSKASGDGTDYAVNSQYKITEDLKLYAKWIELYRITYNFNGDDNSTLDEITDYLEPNSVQNVQINGNEPQKTGYIFGGWNTKADGTGTHYDAQGATITITGNITLYAQWVHECDGVIYDRVITSQTVNLTEGKYYLAGNIKPSEALKIADSSSVAICMNGYVIDGSNVRSNSYQDSIISLGSESSLVINDCCKNREHKYSIDATSKLATLDEENGNETISGAAIYVGSRDTFGSTEIIELRNKSNISINNVTILGISAAESTSLQLFNYTFSEGNDPTVSLKNITIRNNSISGSYFNLIAGFNLQLENINFTKNTFTLKDNSYLLGGFGELLVDNLSIKDNVINIVSNSATLLNAYNYDYELKNTEISNNTINLSYVNTGYIDDGVIFTADHDPNHTGMKGEFNNVTIENNDIVSSSRIPGLIYVEGNLKINNSKLNENEIKINDGGTNASNSYGLVFALGNVSFNNSEISKNKFDYTNSIPNGLLVCAFDEYDTYNIAYNIEFINGSKIEGNTVEFNIDSNKISGVLVSTGQSTVTFSNSTIKENKVKDEGSCSSINGSIARAYNGEIVINNTNINKNNIDVYGKIDGGLFNCYKTTIENSSVYNNAISNVNGAINGGLFNDASLTLDCSSLMNNEINVNDASSLCSLSGGLVHTTNNLIIKDTSAQKDKTLISNNIIKVIGNFEQGANMNVYGHLLYSGDISNITDISIMDNTCSMIKDTNAQNEFNINSYGAIYAYNDFATVKVNYLRNTLTSPNIFGGFIYSEGSDVSFNNLYLNSNSINASNNVDGGLIYINGYDENTNKTSFSNSRINENTINCNKSSGSLLKLNNSVLFLDNTSINANVITEANPTSTLATIITNDNIELNNKVVLDNNKINGNNIGILFVGNWGSLEPPMFVIGNENTISTDSILLFKYAFSTNDIAKINEKPIIVLNGKNDSIQAEQYLSCILQDEKQIALYAKGSNLYYGSRVAENPSVNNDYTFNIRANGLDPEDTISYEWYRIGSENDEKLACSSASLDLSDIVFGDFYCIAKIANVGLTYESNPFTVVPKGKIIENSGTYSYVIDDLLKCNNLNINVNYKWFEIVKSSNKSNIIPVTSTNGSKFSGDSYYDATYNQSTGMWECDADHNFAVNVNLTAGQTLVYYSYNIDKKDLDVVEVYKDATIIDDSSYIYQGRCLGNQLYTAKADGVYTLVIYAQNTFVKAKLYIVDDINKISNLSLEDINTFVYKELEDTTFFTRYDAESNQFASIGEDSYAIELNLVENEIYTIDYSAANLNEANVALVKKADFDSSKNYKEAVSNAIFQNNKCLTKSFSVTESGKYYLLINDTFDSDYHNLYTNISIKKINGYDYDAQISSTNELSDTYSGKYFCVASFKDSDNNKISICSDVVDYVDTNSVVVLYEFETGNVVTRGTLYRNGEYDLGDIPAGKYALVIIDSRNKSEGIKVINLNTKTKVSGFSREFLLDRIIYKSQTNDSIGYVLVDGLKQVAEDWFHDYLSYDYDNKLWADISKETNDGSLQYTNLINVISQSGAKVKKYYFFNIDLYASNNQEYKIEDTDSNYLIIYLPFDTENNKDFVIARRHVNSDEYESYDIIPQGAPNEEDGEYYVIKGGYIELHLKKFSLYAIGYNEKVEPVKKKDDYHPVKTGIDGVVDNVRSPLGITSICLVLGLVFLKKKISK